MTHRIRIAACRVSLALVFAAPGHAVELNRASQAELEMLRGVGPQLSERILAEREQARFRSWDDFVARLKGVGPASAARLSAAGLRIGGQPYLPAPVAASAPEK